MRDPYHDHIAIVTTSYPSHAGDWVGHFVREEALELVRQSRGRAHVTVITTRTAISDEGVSVRVFRGGSAFGPPGAIARIAEFPPRAALAAAWTARAFGALRRERFSRVIAHWAIPCAFPIAMRSEAEVRGSDRRRAPLEVVSHGSDVRLLAKMPARVRRIVTSAIERRATAWRFVSPELRDTLLDVLDRDLAARVMAKSFVRAPLLVVPDVSHRARVIRDELGTFDVSVGRLVETKRV